MRAQTRVVGSVLLVALSSKDSFVHGFTISSGHITVNPQAFGNARSEGLTLDASTSRLCNAWTSGRKQGGAYPLQIRSRPRTCLAAVPDFSTVEDYDRFLGELIFSPNDVRDDVIRNFDRCSSEEFQVWLKDKAEASQEMDERLALKNLYEVITKIVDKIKEEGEFLPEGVDESAIADAEFTTTSTSASDDVPIFLDDSAVFAEMKRLDQSGLENSDGGAAAGQAVRMSPFEGLPDNVRSGYEKMLEIILDRPDGQTLEAAVESIYEKCDVQWLTFLKQRIAMVVGTAEAAVLQRVVNSVNSIMSQKMATATERLQYILSQGQPGKMQAAVVELAKKGEVDDALVLLLEGNIEQAKAAGAAPAVKLMEMLKAKVQTELDTMVEPEKRLLRQLLRTDDAAARDKILEEAFRPRAQLALAGGSDMSSQEPLVKPPEFIKVVKTILLNFGNIESAEPEFAAKVQQIIQEAETVATRLYGESQSPQDMQDKAWKDTTVSVFDLEAVENQAQITGEEIPWANDKYDAMLPKGLRGGVLNDKGEWHIGGT